MMKRVLLAAVLSPLFGCSNFSVSNNTPVSVEDDLVTKQFNVGGFSKLDIAIPATISYSYGKASVSVTASEDVMPWIAVTLDRNELDVRIRNGAPNFINPEITITMTSEMLSGVELSGSCKFVTDEIRADEFEAEVSGSSGFEVTAMTADRVTADVSGASALRIGAVKAGYCEIEVSGASNARVDGIDVAKLDVEVSGASTATLDGHCTKASLESSGASKINATALKADNFAKESSGVSKINI